MYKDEGAGRGGAYKGKGAGRQDGHYYPLADPRLAEAHDFSTIVHHTGSDHSTPKHLTGANIP